MKRDDRYSSNFLRLLDRVLHLYYVEDLTRAEVARRLGLSQAEVKQLVGMARAEGMVQIAIRIPFADLVTLEARLKHAFEATDFVVIPAVADDPDTFVHTLGRAGAQYLLNHLRDGDTIAIAGGSSLYSVIQALAPPKKYDVTVVPMAGAVQGRVIADVNFLADQLAERLGGKAHQLYAPAFADTRAQREAVISMGRIQEVLDIARRATIALTGVGTLDAARSSMVQFTALSPEDMERIANVLGGVGEILSQAYDLDGHLCAQEYGERVVGLTLEELQGIPLVIGVAATASKVLPLCGALRGGYLDALITDEVAARGILEIVGR